jgi:glyoxylase-like metal-dependent hydrolase (beta-lactamase superfamily II)
MARLSLLYPRKSAAFAGDARPLPADGTIPTLPSWHWLHTPGHSAGHVCLFRPRDATLIVGDAFCTTKQESFLAVATQRPELRGPPEYFTTDWDAARDSMRELAALNPAQIAPGHGQPMSGPAVTAALQELALDFDRIARPSHGRNVDPPQRE